MREPVMPRPPAPERSIAERIAERDEGRRRLPWLKAGVALAGIAAVTGTTLALRASETGAGAAGAAPPSVDAFGQPTTGDTGPVDGGPGPAQPVAQPPIRSAPS